MPRKRSRAVGRKTKTPSSASPAPLIIAAAVITLVAAGAYLALSGDEGAAPSAGERDCDLTPVENFAHIHGLAVNPSDPSVLYAATHHGLFRAVNDTGWARVGSVEDDLMGFSVHPANGSVMWSSGHPASGGNMGVRQSLDGGCLWTFLALEGVDFHAMAVSPADPDSLWGFYAGKLYRTTDGGHNWSVISQSAPPIYGLAPHPSNADTVYAATADGVQVSKDGGAAWESVTRAPTAALAIARDDPATMLASTQQGVLRSTDGGGTWQRLPLEAGAVVTHIALHPHDAATVYAATAQSAIHKTTDGGATWTEIKPAS